MRNLGWGILFFVLALAWGVQDVFAHARSYVWTQEYKTLPKGVFELENFVTMKVPDGKTTNKNTIEYKEELEYGVTDRLNIAHYQRWQTINRVGPDDDTVYTGFDFEAKYRISDKGKLWVDPLLYLEFKTDVRKEHQVNTLEGKIILSKDFDKLNVTYNQIIESEADNNGRTEHGFAFAGSYEILPALRAGAEFTGLYWHPSDHRNEISLGPTLAYEHTYFWVALGGRFGINRAANDKEARVIVGILF